tara:strand:- start:63 stop:878 length:816 start_codon:yes stop_codon:yes gene_type:complete
MNRFTALSGEKNLVPKLYTQPLLIEEGRAPASINYKKFKPLNYSNRILYFIGLYGQYKTMRNFASAITPIVRKCPHFHSAILEDNHSQNIEFISPKGAQQEKISSLYINAKNNPGLFPELHLPMVKNNISSTVFSKIKNSKNIGEIPFQIQTAVNIHLEKTFGEIKELCESGTSTNYFIFENLTRLQKRKKLSRNETTLKALFKTTLVSNMAIISSLESWSKAKGSLKTKQVNFEIMKRLEGTWVTSYLQKLVQKRKGLSFTGNNKAYPER